MYFRLLIAGTTLLIFLLFGAGCGGEATSCDELECGTDGRLCEQEDDTAWCGDCVDGYVEDGDTCRPPSCQLRDDCPDDDIGEWSECDWETACSETGERSRQVIRWSCGLDNLCSARQETETEQCERETEGDDCLNGSCSAGVCQLHTGPTVTTEAPTRITSDAARLHGHLEATGGRPVTSLELCYGTTPQDLDQCHEFDPLDEPGEFSVDIDELTPNTPYYVEARAANDIDVSSGQQEMFVTVDRCDGNYVVTDDFQDFVDDYAATVCPGDNADCDGACPDDRCLDFTPYPASGCGHVTGHLFVVWNDEMETLPAFEGLTAIDGALRIHDNPALAELDGFNDLFRLDGTLLIEDNDAIESLGGFSSLTDLEGSLHIENTIWPEEAAGIDSFDAFEQLQHIGGDIFMSDLHGLSSVANFGSLESFGGRLNFTRLEQLESLHGLEGIEELTELFLLSNNSLVDLQGLDNLTTVGNLTFWLNESLETLDGLQNLTTVSGNLVIWSNRVLTTLDALENLESVGGRDFWIIRNDILPSCEGEALLDRIDYSGDRLQIENNDDEAECD